MTQKFKWRVQVADGRTGATEEFDYTAGWDPAKVSPESVAQAAAAERTIETKTQHMPLKAEPAGAAA